MLELSQGQQLALHQLLEIAGHSNGTLDIVREPEPATQGAYRVRLSLATGSYRKPGGFAFRDRERLVLLIYPDFPFRKPELYFDHKRFLGHPHVQWGTYVCLYQSAETEYDPSDGLFGFFDRINLWMTAAGNGQLDPDDAPLHPPVAYVCAPVTFVAKADAPIGDATGVYWLGRADLRKMRPDRSDIVGWTHLKDWGDPDPAQPAAMAILFGQPLATEYPTKVNDLIDLVENAGLEFDTLYRLLRLYALLTPDGDPAYCVLGAPMRRKGAGEPLRPHLTVWEIDAAALASLRRIIASEGTDAAARGELVKWMASAGVSWCEVMEDRPEIVRRRDDGSQLATLAGRRVLLFGCGALGSAIAEMLVRAGVAAIHLVDANRVKPGILVRQRYSDADIGRPKAGALQGHLTAIGLPCAITSERADLADRALSRFALDQWDIVLDATASTRVTHRLEQELKAQALPTPLLTLSVSAAAQHGCLIVRMPGHRGGPHRIARRAKLEAFARASQHELVKAFWPTRDEFKIFQPEPGCSAPTFLGSAADIDHHAASLLNLGIHRVQSLATEQASVDLISASWLVAGDQNAGQLHYVFDSYSEAAEQRHGYTVLQSQAAERGMVAEMRRMARTRSEQAETGGLLFGEIDDSHRYIWIDSVSGPPPDSQASATRFLCGTAGTKELATFRAKSSGDSSKFVGIWHTHPISRGRPSPDDLEAMVQLLHGQEHPPRQTVMLIVGFAASTPEFNYYLFRRDEFRLIPIEALQAGGET